MATTPAHLAPENCYICGCEPHEDTATAGHTFWSNADATKHFTQQRPITHHQCAPRGPAALAVGGIRAGDTLRFVSFVGVVS